MDGIGPFVFGAIALAIALYVGAKFSHDVHAANEMPPEDEERLRKIAEEHGGDPNEEVQRHRDSIRQTANAHSMGVWFLVGCFLLLILAVLSGFVQGYKH